MGLVGFLLVALLAFMVTGSRPRRGPARRWQDLRDYRRFDTAATWVPGMLTAVAATTITHGTGPSGMSDGAVGATLGIGFAVLARRSAAPVRRVVQAFVGGAAAVVGAIKLITAPPVERWWITASGWVVFAVALSVGFLFAMRYLRLRSQVGLSVFGAISVLRFVIAPQGMPLLGSGF